MKQHVEIPEDPTRPMRRLAIHNSIARCKELLHKVGKSDMTPAEIAVEAHLRLERAKTVGTVEHAAVSAKLPLSE